MRNTTNRIEPVLFWSRTGLNRFWFGNLRNRIEPVSDSIGTGLVKSRIESNRNMPELCLFYVPGQPSKKTLFEKQCSDGEEITTGKTGTTFCIRSGHKINWFLAFQTLPVFPVVTIRHIGRDKGQKAGPHMGPSRLYRYGGTNFVSLQGP